MIDDDFLYRQLEKLGDMIGDGLHLEPGGKWISTEYNKIAKSLGLIKNKKRDVSGINSAVKSVISNQTCTSKGCEGALKQSRSGSYVIQCLTCHKRYKLKKKR